MLAQAAQHLHQQAALLEEGPLVECLRRQAGDERRVWRVAAEQCARRSAALLAALPEAVSRDADIAKLRELDAGEVLRIYAALRLQDQELALALRELVVLCVYARVGSSGDAFHTFCAASTRRPQRRRGCKFNWPSTPLLGRRRASRSSWAT